jgi:hypothetical protein
MRCILMFASVWVCSLSAVGFGRVLLCLCSADASDFADTFEGCDVSAATELVFFPLNDNANVTGMGGTHWTLLVMDVQRAALYSFDSMGRGGKVRITHSRTACLARGRMVGRASRS